VNSNFSGNFAQRGGALFIFGTLNVLDSTFDGNAADPDSNGRGGAIFFEGDPLPALSQIVRGNFVNNHAFYGGALGSITTRTIRITDSTWAGNQSEYGGAINNSGLIEVIGNTFSSNSANLGGAVFNEYDISIINSTVSGNSANEGGGIYNYGSLYIAHSTFAGNSALQGGGIRYVSFSFGIESLAISHSLLKSGTFGSNLESNKNAPVTSIGHNLVDDDGGGLFTGPGDLINIDPLIGPLQDNGGPTMTHALLPGSPAIDTGSLTVTLPPTFDQRGTGFPRFIDGNNDGVARIDIGAFEFLAPTAAGVRIGGRVTDSLGRGIYGARISLTGNHGEQRLALTNPFGFYRFEDITAGESYIVGAFSRRYKFAVPQIFITADSDIADMDFVATGP